MTLTRCSALNEIFGTEKDIRQHAFALIQLLCNACDNQILGWLQIIVSFAFLLAIQWIKSNYFSFRLQSIWPTARDMIMSVANFPPKTALFLSESTVHLRDLYLSHTFSFNTRICIYIWNNLALKNFSSGSRTWRRLYSSVLFLFKSLVHWDNVSL